MTPDAIRGEVQLLVEGNDERNFFAAFTEHLQLPNVEIQAFGSKDRLREFLETLAGATDFKQVKRIGIVRDADASADAAFQSVQTSLRNANAGIRSSGAEFPVPDRPEQLVGEQPALSVMVLPGDGQAGMLETLLCRTFAGDDMDRCIDRFFQCAEESGTHIRRPDKARARAYLATTPDPHLSVGVAAKRDQWDMNHGAFDGVRGFLRSLAPHGTRTPQPAERSRRHSA